MATELQKKLATEIIKNVKRKKPKNRGQLLEASGYARKSATSVPGKIINQIGVKEALKDFGFTEDNAKKVVAQIMLNKKTEPNARLKATDQVFKVHGSYKDEGGRGNTLNILNIFNEDQMNKIAAEVLKKRKDSNE